MKSFQDQNFVYMEGYASTFGNQDEHGDIVIHGAFSRYLSRNPAAQNSSVKVLWQHDHSKPIGIAIMLQEDSRGLRSKIKIALKSPHGSEAIALAESGIVEGLSIGYIPIRYERDLSTGKRMISEARLIEISLVTFPANPLASISSIWRNNE